MKKVVSILWVMALLVTPGVVQADVFIFDDEVDFLSLAHNPTTYDFEVSSGFPAEDYIGLFDGIGFDAETYASSGAVSGDQGMAGVGDPPTFGVATLDFTGLAILPNGFGFWALDLTVIGPEVIRVNVNYTTAGLVSYDVQLPHDVNTLTPIYFGLVNSEDTIDSIEMFGTEVGSDVPSRAWYIDDLTIAGIPVCYPDLPAPELVAAEVEDYTTSGGYEGTRYYLNVDNWADFPDELFEAAPDLPPCGLNPNASRTWVSIYNAETDVRIYGFCGLGESADLNSIWFAMPRGVIPPCVYITLMDRRCGITYTSNAVCFPYEVNFDIKPGSCPNPFNAKSKGSVPMAIVGNEFLDVTLIDPNTITLTTPSGNVIMPLGRFLIDDVTQPDDGDPNDCFACFDADDPNSFNCDLWDASDPNNPPVPGTDGILDSYCGDGYPDMVFKFDTQELADAIGSVPRGTCVELYVDALLKSGGPIYGSDSVLTLKK